MTLQLLCTSFPIVRRYMQNVGEMQLGNRIAVCMNNVGLSVGNLSLPACAFLFAHCRAPEYVTYSSRTVNSLAIRFVLIVLAT